MRQKAKALLRTLGRRAAISVGLEAASVLSAAGLMSSARGHGAIFTLHHVRPKRARKFDPNAHLEITPEFLDRALTRLTQDGYAFIPLEDIPQRLKCEKDKTPFAAFTLDDGYRNNLDYALPIFAKHNAAFTVFVTKGLTERTHTIWWETLADILEIRDDVVFDFGWGPENLDLRTKLGKHTAFCRFAGYLHRIDETLAVHQIGQLAAQYGLDEIAIVKNLVMDSDEIRMLARHPLASIGAHSGSHRALARLPALEAEEEMAASADYIESIIGQRPKSIAYPYGGADAATSREALIAQELGFTVGVSTKPGTLDSATTHPAYMPRISLNGYYQKERYVSALSSGIPFRLIAA